MGNNRGKNQIMRKLLFIIGFICSLPFIGIGQNFTTYYFKGIDDDILRQLNAERNDGTTIKSMQKDKTGYLIIGNTSTINWCGVPFQASISSETKNGITFLYIVLDKSIITVSSQNVISLQDINNNKELFMYDVYNVDNGFLNNTNGTQSTFQPSQQNNSNSYSQYQYWENIARDYYQKLGYETNASLRTTYMSGYKQAQAQMQQIRASNYNIQQSQFEYAPSPSNPGK